MAKIRFQIACPACSDPHFAVECKKPKYFTPTVVKTQCDECEARSVLRVSFPSDKIGVQIQFVSIIPSEKLVNLLLARQSAKADATNESTEIPTPITDNSESLLP